MTKYMVANWKMNGSLETAHDFCQTFTRLFHAHQTDNTIVIFPPHPYLSFTNGALSGTDISLGAQDCSGASEGAFTGETSATMLADVGCSYVIIGHSERRQQHQESNTFLSDKIKCALEANLRPIFCIGESEQDFETGKTQEVLKTQLQVLNDFKGNDKLILAYEPVWAIGTGKVARLDDIENTCAFLKKELFDVYQLSSPILYGGSVKADNAKDILSLQSIGGVLVGGASLKPDEFWKISTAIVIPKKPQTSSFSPKL